MSEQIIEKYVWVSNGGCDACDALGGEEFKKIEDIPDKPHPNCKCTVREVNGEICDYCIDQLDKIQETVGDANSLQAEISEMMSNLTNAIMTKAGQIYESTGQSIIDEAATWDNALGDFARNYNDMVKANTIGSDKYFHTKANCEATQRGAIGEITAEAVSLLREVEEGARKVIFDGVDLIEQIKDAQEDMEANKDGREKGRQNPDAKCGDVIDKYRPKWLPNKY